MLHGLLLRSGLLAFLALSLAAPSYAGFLNGGFEDGTFNGWTRNGGTWNGGSSYTYISGDQGLSQIVSQGEDPVLLARGAHLPMVYAGDHAARVNHETGGGYHVSTIQQTVAWDQPSIYFAWAAVLEEAGHPHEAEPHFLLKLEDLTASTTLYEVFYASDTIPSNLLHTAGSYKYTDWQVVQLDTSGVIGDTLRLTLLASDCAYGAHSGAVYLDGFGSAEPPSNVVPEPASLTLLGLGGLGMWLRRRRTRKA